MLNLTKRVEYEGSQFSHSHDLVSTASTTSIRTQCKSEIMLIQTKTTVFGFPETECIF